MKPLFVAALLCITAFVSAAGQAAVNKAQFFIDTNTINATLTLNLGKLLSHREKEGYRLPATFSCTLNGAAINDHIAIETRGQFRRSICYMPPLKMVFNADTTAALRPLKSLKLVSECKTSAAYISYLYKEFLVYKMYNLLTDKSFRVRLITINVVDSAGKKSPFIEQGFLIEDIKELARRVDCTEFTKEKLITEATDRSNMTLVNIFEYMIGNTDFAVPVNHNIRLIKSTKDSLTRPFAIPYDFDFSGLVGTDYSAPDERLGIATVQERSYRGFVRNLGEVNVTLDVFRQRKDAMYAIINSCNLVTPNVKKEMINYLDEFYVTINKPSEVKRIFVDNARTE